MNDEDAVLDLELLSSFLDESQESIQILNTDLLEAEAGRATDGMVQEMFRAAHSVKGCAGFLDLKNVTQLTHHIETVLDTIRKKKNSFTPAIIEALFAGCDMLSTLISHLRHPGGESVDIAPVIAKLENACSITAVTAESASPGMEESLTPFPEFLKGKLDRGDIESLIAARCRGNRVYALRFSFRECYLSQLEPTQIYKTIGQAVTIQTVVAFPYGADSPWRPLAEYDYRVALICIAPGALLDSLPEDNLMRCEAWEIGNPQQPQEMVVIDPPGRRYRPAANERLEVKPDMAQHLNAWRASTREELDTMENAVLAFEESPMDDQWVAQIFRMLHSIKGGAASMGLDPMARIAHNGESLLTPLREKNDSADAVLFQILYGIHDYLKKCIDRVDAGETNPPDATDLDKLMRSRLKSDAQSMRGLSPALEKEWSISASTLVTINDSIAAGLPVWRIIVSLFPKAPLPDIRYCMLLKNIETVARVIDSWPTRDQLENGIDDPPPLQIIATGQTDVEAIRQTLDADLVMHIGIGDWANSANASETASAQNQPATSALPDTATGTAEEEPARDVPEEKTAASKINLTACDTLRVETFRLDGLLNATGELVITKARTVQLCETLVLGLQQTDLSLLTRITEEYFKKRETEGQKTEEEKARVSGWFEQFRTIQDTALSLRDATMTLHRQAGMVQTGAMQLRMVPIGPLFQRFHRLVRDVARESGKAAVLETYGDQTELDKKLIDELTDPLTHMVRNAVDHGLETPEERRAAGKPEKGTVRLAANHEGGQIAISITDDGKGIDMERLRKKAVQLGWYTQDSVKTLSDEDLTDLIFRPGFSTARQVTNISGRGVGMDIVKSKIMELKGKVHIRNTPGQGIKFTIRLPLTLAMIKALLVEIGGAHYAFPLETVREVVNVDPEQIRSIHNRGRLLYLRERPTTLVDLKKVMSMRSATDIEESALAVVIKNANEPLAIPVSRVIGEQEIVVKGLPPDFAHVKGFSGATFLGDGSIALIFDVSAMGEIMKKNQICGEA